MYCKESPHVKTSDHVKPRDKTDILTLLIMTLLCFSVGPQVLHGHADLAQNPAPKRAVIFVVELLKLWGLPDLVEERHVDVRLQQQQQCGHSDKQDTHYHGDQPGHAEHAGVDPLIGRQQAQAAGPGSPHSTCRSQAGTFTGPVSLPLSLQLGLDVRVFVELSQQPGWTLDRGREEQAGASLTVIHWSGKHADTGAAEERRYR